MAKYLKFLATFSWLTANYTLIFPYVTDSFAATRCPHTALQYVELPPICNPRSLRGIHAGHLVGNDGTDISLVFACMLVIYTLIEVEEETSALIFVFTP